MDKLIKVFLNTSNKYIIITVVLSAVISGYLLVFFIGGTDYFMLYDVYKQIMLFFGVCYISIFIGKESILSSIMPVAKKDRIKTSYFLGLVSIFVFSILFFITVCFSFKYKIGTFDFQNVSFKLLKTSVETGILLSLIMIVYTFIIVKFNKYLANFIIILFILWFSKYFKLQIDNSITLALYGGLVVVVLYLSYIISFKIFDRYLLVK